MKLGQLREYNMGNIFVKKSCTKSGRKNSRPFSKKSKLKLSLDQQSKVLYRLFLLDANLTAIKI